MQFKSQMLLFTAMVLASGTGWPGPPVLQDESAQVAGRPGEMLRIHYTAEWTGSPADWLVLPPESPLVTWASIHGPVLHTRADGDTQRVICEFTLIPREEGAFEWPGIEIPVAAVPEDAQVLEQEPELWLSAGPVRVTVRARSYWRWLAGAAGGFLAMLGAGAWWYRRRRRNAAPGAPEPSPAEQARMGLHEARRRRLDGDWYGFYLELGRALGQLDAAAGEKARHFEERAREVGYGGIRPSEDEMDGALRDAERALTDWQRRPAE